MPLKKYPKSIYPDPKIVKDLVINKRNVTSGPAVTHLPDYLKSEIILLANTYGMVGNDIQEAIYWVVNDLRQYPKLCKECGQPVKFRSYSEAYRYERCSLECSNGSEKVRHKKEQTTLSNYGVVHHFANSEIKSQIKKTNLERYGVESNMHDEILFKKNMHAQFRLKDYVLPSGKNIKLMGYEPQVLTYLLNEYTEDQFDFDNIPTIKYGDKFYFPDMYIPSENLIIEVKSEYTYRANLDINLLKRQACIDAGYNFRFYIWDDKNKSINKGMI